MTGETDYSKDYIFNVFEVKQKNIGLQFMFQSAVKKLQVMLNLIQTPLAWPNINTIKKVLASVV